MYCADTSVLLQLFDAALVANNEHAASWHGWGLLEKRQGNFRKARDLWMKVCSYAQHIPGHPAVQFECHVSSCSYLLFFK